VAIRAAEEAEAGVSGEGTKRNYIGRWGQPVTDPRAIEARRLLTQLRRLMTIRTKNHQRSDVPITDLARAAKMTPERVVEIVREFDVWLWSLVEDGPIENWKVFEDGE
jgi:hypothetical protein